MVEAFILFLTIALGLGVLGSIICGLELVYEHHYGYAIGCAVVAWWCAIVIGTQMVPLW